METNSFGRKIKSNFSLTFKKEEESLKLFLNEQISPSAYIKKLILEDMQKGESVELSSSTKNSLVTSKNVTEEEFDINDFGFDFED